MEKLKMHSPNLTQDNIARIAELFPGCVTEAKGEDGSVKLAVDFDQLRQELTESLVEGPQERYHLNWPGKREALLTANAPIAKTLRPCRDESVHFDTTKNLFIEGDNLDALKLLRETYLGKVKMIYIDPPYNTGSDLIYEDCFASDLDKYFLESNQKDKQGNRLTANTDSNGRFHSDWLSMIYARLKLSRPLLRDDGFIFISIGNDEVSNLKKVCDEVFGEQNFIECVSWNKRIPKNDKGIGNIHDFILIYAKDATVPHELVMRKDGLEDIYELIEKLKKAKTPIAEAEKEIKKLYKKQGYDRGITLYNSFDENYRLWGKINMSWPNANTFGPRYDVPHPITGNPVAIPDRGWRWKKETFWEAAKFKDGKYESIVRLHDGSVMCGRIWFAKTEATQPSSITYLDDVNTFLLRSILSLKSDGGIEVENIFEGKSYFSYPKPTSLLKILLSSLKLNDGDVVMDYFAGSSTTAHAVMQVNAEDGINRRFVMVQLAEPCNEDTEAYKAGFKSIADVSKERIRRSGKLVVSDNSHSAWDKDVGFRTLKVDTSNMADVYYAPDALEKTKFDLFVDNIKPDRTPEDLLFQVMLDWGVDLALPIAKQAIQGKDVFLVDGNALAACFDGQGGVDEAFVKELAKVQPLRVVFRDAGFKDSSVKINVEQIFKLLSPATEVKCI
ncbi:site-specific DNA-methyltransferase [Zoogloea sp.]|uniref:site-specific DNA-methyltransferase n=1 Tax=Zoogloea sp. TaxID=49181 RepID=UPI0035B40A02